MSCKTIEGGLGREGLRQYFRTLSATLEEFRAVGDDYRDLGDRVLWLGRVEGRGRDSGVPVDALSGTLAHFHDGRSFRTRGFLDHGEALRAAGLSG